MTTNRHQAAADKALATAEAWLIKADTATTTEARQASLDAAERWFGIFDLAIAHLTAEAHA